MSTTNASPKGKAVNPTTEEPSNIVPFEASRFLGAEASARKVNLEAEEHKQLYRHSVDREGQRKPPSLPILFARRTTECVDRLWACQATSGTGEIVHHWNGTYWQAISDAEGVGVASDWIDRNADFAGSPKLAKDCWDMASLRLRQKNPMPAQAKRAIVPVADGYVEILPGGFHVLAPDPALGMTHAVRVACGGRQGHAYKPQPLPADSRFAKFLRQAHDDPRVIDLLQEQCGMTLLPGVYSQAAWWHGVAGSGKSTLAEIVEAMHRQVARCNLETLGDRFSLEPMIGASLILVDEVECEKWAEGRFKTMVSGNGIGIDRKNQKQLANYHSTAKWIITSNSAPFIRDKSNGVWRRLTVVHWKKAVPVNQHDPDLVKNILAEEGQLVLDWMLEGARRIVARGRALSDTDADMPEAVRAAKLAARHGSDQVMAWAQAERVVRIETDECTLSMRQVYENYKNWGYRQGLADIDLLTGRQFWRGLKEMGLDDGARSNRRINGKQEECVRLRINGAATVGEACGDLPLRSSATVTALRVAQERSQSLEPWETDVTPTLEQQGARQEEMERRFDRLSAQQQAAEMGALHADALREEAGRTRAKAIQLQLQERINELEIRALFGEPLAGRESIETQGGGKVGDGDARQRRS